METHGFGIVSTVVITNKITVAQNEITVHEVEPNLMSHVTQGPDSKPGHIRKRLRARHSRRNGNPPISSALTCCHV